MMKFKRFTGLLLTFVMSAACITTGFAEDIADSTEAYEAVEEAVEAEEESVETEGTNIETVYDDDIAETEEITEKIAETEEIGEAEENAAAEEEEISEDEEPVLADGIYTESEDEAEAVFETAAIEAKENAEIDLETEISANLATTVSYAVTGGSITLNLTTGAVTACDSSVTAVDIPSSYNGVSITSIGSYAFQSCSNIISVTIPSSITTIGSMAFQDCTNLKSITIPSSVTEIKGFAFDGCLNLATVNNNASITTIAGYTFSDCVRLTSVTIPDSVLTIDSGAFSGCTLLTKISLPSSLLSIGSFAFYNCSSLTSVTMPSEVITIDTYAFDSCISIKTLSLNEGLTTIGDYAFDGCIGITSLTLPESLNSIGSYSFRKCTSLSSLTILSTVLITSGSKYISNSKSPFYKCSSLSTLYCYEGSTVDSWSWSSGVTKSYLKYTVKPTSFSVAGVLGGRNVTFSSATSGAVIYYSLTSSNLTTDDTCVSNGETVLFEDFYGTVYAKAYYNGTWSNVSRLILKIPVANTPTITVSGTKATIKSSTPNAYIYYTTDGTTPTLSNGTNLGLNGGTITVSDDNIIKAIAVRSCFTNSSVATYNMPGVFDGTVAPPSFTVVGTFGGRNVTFTSTTSKAKIYYSSTTSSLTTSDKCISNGETILFEDFYGTIYARAYYNGVWSNVARLILKIPTINDPTITYENGKATIRTTTPSCYIYYTTDGSTPSITNGKKLCSNSYGQVTVSSGTTIKAIAVRSCFTNSTVTTYKVS